MRYLLLGPIEAVREDGTTISWPRASVRLAILVVLVHRRGEYVSRLDLVDTVYGEDDRASTPTNVGSHLSHLRSDLGAFVVGRPGGGGWSVPADTRTDVDDVDELLVTAGRALASRRFADAARHARAALDLFRGDPLGSLRAFDGLRAVVDDLDARRDRALALLIVAAAATGEHEQEQALRRRALGHGRAEQLRRALDGAEYLASRPVLRPVPDTGRPALVGRDELIAELRERVRADDAAGVRRIVVWLSGPPGVGKSSVARRLAQELDGNSEAGQIDLDLVGTPQRPRAADSVRMEVLRRLGRLDRDSRDWTRDYARAVADRCARGRMLLLLDHVDDVEQVAGLLPAAGDRATVIVVSQRRIAPAAVAGSSSDHARDLTGLTDAAAHDLLRDIVGRTVVERSPDDVRRLLRSCGGLPLHLVVVGGKIAAGGATLRESAAAVEEQAVTFLDDSELSVGTRLTIAARGAPDAVTLALAAVARLDCPTVDPVLVAAVIEASQPDAERALAAAARRRLLDPAPPAAGSPHWRVHSAYRSFGRSLHEAFDWPAAVARACRAGAVWWDAVLDRLDPGFVRPAVVSGAPRDTPAAPEAARRVDDEMENLLALLAQAHRERLWVACWQLAAALLPLMDVRLAVPHWGWALDVAEEAARSGGLPAAIGWVEVWRGPYLRHRGDFGAGFRSAARAHRRFADLDDELGQAAALNWMGDLRAGESRPGEGEDTRLAEAEDLTWRSLVAFERLGHVGGIASAALGLGEVLAMGDDGRGGLRHLDTAMEAYRLLGNERGLAQTHRIRAVTLRRLDGPAAARVDADAAERHARASGDPAEIAAGQVAFGVLHHALGDLDAARLRLEQAEYFFRDGRDRWRSAWSAYYLAAVVRDGDPTDRRWRALVERAMAVFDDIGRPDLAGQCRSMLAGDGAALARPVR